MGRRVFAVVLAALAAGCGSEASDESLGGPRQPFPELFCPGSPGCTGEGDHQLRVGAARALITPDLEAAETEWEDLDGDGEWDSNEPFTDENGNGDFDAVWMAGFGNGRPANAVHSDLWVRAIVFDDADIRVGLAVIDVVGWFQNDIDATRELLAAELDLDHVIIASTHNHEGPDTIGLWGEKELVPGTDPDYLALVRQRTADALADAVARLEPVVMTVAQIEAVDESGSSLPWVGDNRAPNILDPTITAMQFLSMARPGETVATLVNWAAHAEYSGSRNNELTADYPYMLREVVENGVEANEARGLPALEGLGGEVVFVNGALGGQIGPNGVSVVADDGSVFTDDGLEVADAVGRDIGRFVLTALSSAELAVDVDAPALSFRTGKIDLMVENTFYHVGALVGVFDRAFFGYDDTQPIGPGNYPFIESRVTYLQLGPVAMVTAPGELHPEIFIGGYDGSRSYGADLVDPDNPNPPPLESAPQPPYLRDLALENPGVAYPIVLGLAEDFVGYIVPSYNYQLHPAAPFIEEMDGDHYEETNSVGPQVESQAVGAMRDILQWRPD